MAFHEENASRRLASQSTNIYLIPPEDVPILYRKEFIKLRNIVGKTIKELSSSPGLTPTRLRGIGNTKAVKYIILLRNIEDSISAD